MFGVASILVGPTWCMSVFAGPAGQQNIQEVYRVAEEAFHG